MANPVSARTEGISTVDEDAIWEHSVTYELINPKTANTLASFESEEEAAAALARFKSSDPKFANDLVLVAFDEKGLAVDQDEAQEVKRTHGGTRRAVGLRARHATGRRRKR